MATAFRNGRQPCESPRPILGPRPPTSNRPTSWSSTRKAIGPPTALATSTPSSAAVAGSFTSTTLSTAATMRPASHSASASPGAAATRSSATARSTSSSPTASIPIARNFDRVHFHDESYWNLLGDTAAHYASCHRRRRRQAAAVVLDHRAERRPRVRLHPRPLRLDVRRPRVPSAAAARNRVDGRRAGRSLQRISHPRRTNHKWEYHNLSPWERS